MQVLSSRLGPRRSTTPPAAPASWEPASAHDPIAPSNDSHPQHFQLPSTFPAAISAEAGHSGPPESHRPYSASSHHSSHSSSSSGHHHAGTSHAKHVPWEQHVVDRTYDEGHWARVAPQNGVQNAAQASRSQRHEVDPHENGEDDHLAGRQQDRSRHHPASEVPSAVNTRTARNRKSGPVAAPLSRQLIEQQDALVPEQTNPWEHMVGDANLPQLLSSEVPAKGHQADQQQSHAFKPGSLQQTGDHTLFLMA